MTAGPPSRIRTTEQAMVAATETSSRTALTVAVTVAACLALLDASIETVRAGSPGRFWLAGSAVVYLVVGAWIIRQPRFAARLGWNTRATASLFVLLGLLAMTAWLRGATGGMTLLGQPTSVLLSVATAAGVLVGTVRLVRAHLLPVAARWLAAAIGAYGIAAFVLGVTAHTNYPALFHGQAAWQPGGNTSRGAIRALVPSPALAKNVATPVSTRTT